jgi:two-component system, NarL family, response regulator
MIRVAVVDDHPIVRDGIVANLQDAGDIAVAGTASSAAGALALVRRERPDVVLLDLELPDRSGLELIVELKAALPQLRIVIFSAYGGEERVAAALSRGADSYVLKGTPSDELLETIRSAVAGQPRLGAEVAAQLLRSLHTPRRERVTPREREVLGLLAEGLSNKAIAARLNVAERTVRFHVGEILERLGAESRAQAVAFAKQRGLL